ncbi:MAG: 3-keto-disaccharide hydrolase [Planctomycetota bacterium]|jgi:hypothetical protein
MKMKMMLLCVCLSLILGVFGCGLQRSDPKYAWGVHDRSRPLPEVVTPGTQFGDPPSDAIVLFDGTDLSQWEHPKGGPARWKVENGYMEVVRKSGSVRTKQGFGSCQLHIEWATPEVVKGKDQGRGNSGVYLMKHYEVQVLDSYGNTTYADGQAAAIYGQSPPMVNASRGPGQWQSYDIIFHRPVFKGNKVVKAGTVTVFHNGVLVQDNWAIKGPTAHKREAEYEPHEDRLPISLQNHGNPVRYRNIWLRELSDE